MRSSITKCNVSDNLYPGLYLMAHVLPFASRFLPEITTRGKPVLAGCGDTGEIYSYCERKLILWKIRKSSKFRWYIIQSLFPNCELKSQDVNVLFFGTNTQSVPKITIITKSLPKKKGKWIQETRVVRWNTHDGCTLSMPNFEAISPVAYERRVLPPAPQADIHPTVPLTRWRGRTRAVWFSAIGNIGPRITPIIVTEIAAALKEGTSQTINWKLYK